MFHHLLNSALYSGWHFTFKNVWFLIISMHIHTMEEIENPRGLDVGVHVWGSQIKGPEEFQRK